MIDDIHIEVREAQFWLILYLADGDRYEWPIGNPESFALEVNRTLGEYFSEECRIAKAVVAAKRYLGMPVAEPAE